MTKRTIVNLPDGINLHDRHVRQRVETSIRTRLGDVECLWPRRGREEPNVAIAIESRPGARRVNLGAGVKPTQGSEVAAKLFAQGLDLLDFRPLEGYGIAGVLDEETRRVRARFAEVLRVAPHEVEVVLSLIFDERLGRERIDKVCVVRSPTAAAEGRRIETWKALVTTLPNASSGWDIDDDPVSGQVQLSYGLPRELPKRVASAAMLPATIQPDDWWHLPLGISPEGRVVGADLKLAPHGLVVGPTGSGKSVLLRQWGMSAIARGHHLVIIDTNKSGIDFLKLKPWCVAWGTNLSSATDVFRAVYAEGQRRKQILERYAEPSWADLPVEVRQRENIVPLTVIFDEAMSTLIPQPVPKGLDKEDPEVVDANSNNACKGIMTSMLGKIARELRFVGVFLVVAMQRPDATAIQGFGEIRSNLTGTVQLIKPGSIPSITALQMVFAADQVDAAASTIKELDDGSSQGLAVVAAEGGDTEGFRVAFAPVAEIPALVEGMDAQPPKPWPGMGVAAVAPLIPTVPKPETVHVEASLDDLEAMLAELDGDTEPEPESESEPESKPWSTDSTPTYVDDDPDDDVPIFTLR